MATSSASRSAPRAEPATVRRWPLLAAFAAALLLSLLTLARLPVRTDLLAMLDTGDAATRLLAGMMARGQANLVLAAVEAPGQDAARVVAGRLAAALAQVEGVGFATDGRQGLDEQAIGLLFDRRYLLSPAVAPDAFTSRALRGDATRLLDQLAGAAAPLAERWGLRDPTGAFVAVLRAWGGEMGATLSGEGGWVAPAAGGGARALLLIGLTPDQALGGAAAGATLERIRAAFDQARGAEDQRLVLAGPATLAAAASEAVHHDVRLLSILSTLAIAALLVWRFRSPLVLAAIAIPVLLAFDVAAWVTVLRFGSLDAIVLGFGSTMLGMTVDYPVLLIGHRKLGEPPGGTVARIGATFAAAVATAAMGLGGMAFSSIRPVAELGTFAVAGLVAAALATRLLLPGLVARCGLGPVGAGDPRLLRRVESWRRLRPAALVLLVAAAGVIAARGGVRLDLDLARLAPVPASLRAEDARLRAALGAAEPGDIALVAGADPQSVLEREERLRPLLDELRQRGVIGRATLAADLVPSLARQRAVQAALPDAARLRAALDQAQAGLPFRADAFDPFLADVERARTAPPVEPRDLAPPMLAARLAMLLVPDGEGWAGLVTFDRVSAPGALARALQGAGVSFLDVAGATRELAARAVANARLLMALGGMGAVLALLAWLRDARRVARIVAAVASALLVTVAAVGGTLSLMHLVALQFVAGIVVHYALFFSRGPIDEEERARTLRTLATCASAALIAFGLLCLCRTPLLYQLGQTVSVGVVGGMVFAFLLARPTRTAG